MSGMELAKTRIRAGVWEGVLTVSGPHRSLPQIEVLHLETPLEGVLVTADDSAPDSYQVKVPIPSALLSDGVQTFLIRTAGDGQTLGSFTIVTGEPLEDDIRAEMDLLRAELDMLKKAFRRHCLETM
ncbi:MAG: hypothetical protein CL814_07815 [Confluentimicrobium sp.]|nr:hypothetical protein [Actibacterium sp.]KGB82479.1 hypothetical protein JT55_07390 [Rhodovulum sp. NI22]MBC56827.1 hypothetical protein [Actibacterium sp.]|tara:strand:+ start:5156 stop:5536 length:381 start_codon:yes stop_codon:yes gene_type:complete